jgi:hypothetical protein
MDTPASAPCFLLLIVSFDIVAITTWRTGRPDVVRVTLEPPLHLALDLGICYTCGGLEVGGVDLAGQGDGGSLWGLRCVVGHASSDAEELKEVVELAVNVSAYCDWRSDGLNVRLWRHVRQKLCRAYMVTTNPP